MDNLSLAQKLAILLLRHPQRYRKGIVQLDNNTVEQFKSGAIKPNLYDDAHKFFSDFSPDDLDAALSIFLKKPRTIINLYQVILDTDKTLVTWRNQRPTIAARYTDIWLRLTDFLDEDVLLAVSFMTTMGPTAYPVCSGDIAAWRTVARAADYDLQTMWAKGLSDLHIHVGGARIPQMTWLELMAIPENTIAYPKLRRAMTGQQASTETKGWPRPRSDFESVIRSACVVREKLFTNIKAPCTAVTFDRSSPWHFSKIYNERLKLINGLYEYEQSKNINLLKNLDRYASDRHSFFTRAKQKTFGQEQGLHPFGQKYFSLLKARKSKAPTAGGSWTYRESPRLRYLPYADAYRFLQESPDLRKVELRIAPMNRAVDYWRFFARWEKYKKEFLDKAIENSGLPNIDIRFAIHFKRTRNRNKLRPNDDDEPHTISLLREIDRQSAALRAALGCPERSDRLKALARIDVAGQERDTQASIFGAHLRLLRGEKAALKLLEKTINGKVRWTNSDKIIRHWKKLYEQKRHAPSPQDRVLGLTIHAGEDYADRLDGLYQIASAIESCKLQSGDAIGHGLALYDDKNHYINSTERFIPLGAHFDSLCWLYRLIQPAKHGVALAPYLALENAIVDNGREIFRPEDNCDASDYVCAWSIAHQLTDSRLLGTVSGDKGDVLAAQRFDENIERRRMQPVSIRTREQFQDLIETAAKLLQQRIIQERIVIEMNPSSNIRITGQSSIKHLVTIKIFKAISDGLLACINTDDPGVFTSCIENEYAVIMNGAREEGFNEGVVRDLLEKTRSIGMNQVYWGS